MDRIDDEISTQPVTTYTIELSRDLAEAILSAIAIAQDEAPWSQYEEAWSASGDLIREKLAQ